MANTTKVSARMDPELKKEAEDILDDMGLNFSVWITLATKALVNERKIPFEIKASPFYSDANIKELEKRYAEYKQDKGIEKHDLLGED
ncbi:type II toxin-antitoxin system RelB/DinJ family antitoxin [Limosilactobacillus mucosae]|uniref:type II toxin-antitoxin system RelB/DinJ family antitoxin n=1 Tax=Limosilactobacillus mucosae TaxID=97478 RepID=UPI00233EC846|nr:type II toxin-antitoxin system RelB/DinJ family antitoxin [Limosilactobacillus mucosae]MDC2839351.1 type II toxin-antitoxin system RelB/DinJ family antitoxin [Limosilactobacillus mucosae]MDC2841219.1 type II toxin-antitoxin system RelB/DinJ family antitoxin [Limosilactobacillus mucosae]MDC2845309.1 type II toxin-antitoxin system RelB/DinJ family antitoxin [Limosilactobacillus mucosae]